MKNICLVLVVIIFSACGSSDQITLYGCSCTEKLVDGKCLAVEFCHSRDHRIDRAHNKVIPEGLPFAYVNCNIFDKSNWSCKTENSHETKVVVNGKEIVDPANYIMFKNQVRSISALEYWIKTIKSILS